MFNRKETFNGKFSLGGTKDGINTITHFDGPVHDHKMTGILNGIIGFYIFYGKHVVIIAMNVIDIGMLPVAFPVDGLVNRPVGIWQVYCPS